MSAPRAAEIFIPDGDEARQWAEQELSRPEYQAAKPTWFDEFVTGVVDWFRNLFTADGSASVAPVAVTLIVVVLVAALVVALLIWGRPRASRTVAQRRELLGERDDRTAAQLRSDADRCASAGDWDTAIVLRYRALARGLLERDLIDPAPGATAQGIAREAQPPFPGLDADLHQAATLFDAVRYLRTPADEADYRSLAALDDALAAAVPVQAGEPQAVPA